MAMNSVIKKHSLVIRGHSTSISLEDEFWNALCDLADEKAVGTSALVEQIDEEQKNSNLSSAIRVFVFKRYRAMAKLAWKSCDDGAHRTGK